MNLAYTEYQMTLLTENKGAIKQVKKLATTEIIKLAETTTQNTELKSFWDFLIEKKYINDDGIVQIEKLLGNKTALGNGSGEIDVYKLEEENGNYSVIYYGKNNETITIWSQEQKDSSTPPEGGDIPNPPTPTIPPTVEEAIENGEVLSNDSQTTIKDEYENIIKIPAGFKIAKDSGTDVTQGVVIEDVSAGTETTKGSQFVWIPVGDVNYSGGTKTINLNRYTFASNGTPTGQEANIIDSYFEELKTSSYGNTTAKNIDEFKTSANDNHGYYIGRYEAGDPTATSNRTDSSSKTTPIVCKEDQFVYNNITQSQATNLAKTMYEGKTFTSDLINSYAWDTATRVYTARAIVVVA